MATPGVHTPLHDPDLPAMPVLLGPGAIDVLNRAVAEEGGTIRSLRPDHASYRPGRRIVVAYEAEVVWAGKSATDETIVAFARDRDPPRGSLPVEVEGMPVGGWRLPQDPYLPGLKRAEDRAFVRELLDRLGAPGGPIQVTRRAYWPRTRAVIEVAAATPKGKVVFAPGQGLAKAPSTRLMYLKV